MWGIFGSIADFAVNQSWTVDKHSFLLGAFAASATVFSLMWLILRRAHAQGREHCHTIQVQNRLITILETELADTKKTAGSLQSDTLDNVLARADEEARGNDFLAELRCLLDWWERNRATLAVVSGKLGDRFAGYGHHSSGALREALGFFQIAAAADPAESEWRDGLAAMAEALNEADDRGRTEAFDIYEAELRASRPEELDSVFEELETEVEGLIHARQYFRALRTATRAGRLIERESAETSELKQARAMWLWAKAAHFAGKLQDGLAIAQEAWDIRKRLLPPDHPDTLTSGILAAEIMVKLEQDGEALPIARHVWEARKHSLSEDHCDTLASAALVAQIKVHLKQDEQALPIARDALEAMKRTLPKGAPGIFQLAKLAADIEKRLSRAKLRSSARSRGRKGERSRAAKAASG